MSLPRASRPLTCQRVRTVLKASGFRVMYADQFGRRTGTFLRQGSATTVRVVIDVDTPSFAAELAERAITILRDAKLDVQQALNEPGLVVLTVTNGDPR